jgi:hypothetical protein
MAYTDPMTPVDPIEARNRADELDVNLAPFESTDAAWDHIAYLASDMARDADLAGDVYGAFVSLERIRRTLTWLNTK